MARKNTENILQMEQLCDIARKKHRKLVEIQFVFTVDNYVVSHHKLCTQNVVSLSAS